MPTTSFKYNSNLTRFRPRIAAKASGTPLRRYEQTVQHAQDAVSNRRRLPVTSEASKRQAVAHQQQAAKK